MQTKRRIKSFWIWLFFIFLALFLLSSNLTRSRSWNPAEQIIVEVTAPLQNFVTRTIDITEHLWQKYFYLIGIQKENRHLREGMDALKIENYRYRELIASHERFQELLGFEKKLNWPVLAAQVIGRDPSGWFESVIIDMGKKSGLKINMPVVNANGVVGRLVSVSTNYAKVLLIIDQNSAVDCLIQRSRDKGIAKGISSKMCKLDYALKTSDIAVGDRVITSGLGRIFPKGIPVGQVVEINDRTGDLFRDIKIKPMVDFSKLEEVLVIFKEDPLASQQQKKD
ncbi:rod shape-determining protein MreC [Thermodesulfobacteriota bacterium]